MLRNLFTTAFRALRRHGGYTLINLLGLVLGFSICLLLGLLAHNFLTWDTFHEEPYEIFQLTRYVEEDGSLDARTITPAPLLPTLEREFPGVETGTRFRQSTHQVQGGHKRFLESVNYADPAFLSIFSFPLSHGRADTALDDPSSVVITAEVAQKYFGKTAVLGRTLRIDDAPPLTITGVVSDPPDNTNVAFDILVPFSFAAQHVSLVRELKDRWSSAFVGTYVRLDDRTAPGDLEAQFSSLLDRHLETNEAARTTLRLVPMPEVFSDIGGYAVYAYVLLALALGVLVVAVVNFTNVTTTLSLRRGTEIGVRRLLGARPQNVAMQFVSETFLLTSLAMGTAFLVVQAALPSLSSFLGRISLQMDLSDPFLLGGIATAWLLTALVAGAYPAVHLSRLQPSEALRASTTGGPNGVRLRRTLVTVQFILALVLIGASFGVREQLQHLKSIDFEFGSDTHVVVNAPPSAFADAETGMRELHTLRRTARSEGLASHVTLSSDVPGSYSNTDSFHPGALNAEARKTYVNYVDSSFFDTYDLEIQAGEGIAAAVRTGRVDGVVVNEAALTAMGWKSHDGKVLYDGQQAHPVLGVVENYYFSSPENPVYPVVHRVLDDASATYRYVTIRSQQNPGEVLSAVQNLWNGLSTSWALNAELARDHYDQELYAFGNKMSWFLTMSALATALTAFIGLIGIASLTIYQRRKEVAIRKALGATTTRVAALLSKDLLTLILIAFAVAAPLVYLVLRFYLQNYAVQTSIGIGFYITLGVLAVLLATLALGYHVARTATQPPVDSLRSE